MTDSVNEIAFQKSVIYKSYTYRAPRAWRQCFH